MTPERIAYIEKANSYSEHEWKDVVYELVDAVRGRDGEIKNLRRELTHQRENNHQRNIQLDALHFVWCSGGCGGGTHRWTDEKLTADIVAEAMSNTTRLYSRFVNLAGSADKEGSVAKRRPLWERARMRVAEAVMQLAVPPGATL